MFRNEERAIRLVTSDRVEVDGIVRVRMLSIRQKRRAVPGGGQYAHRHMVKRCEPVAIAVQRGGKHERIPLIERGVPRVLWFVAAPVAARVVASILINRTRRKA